MNTTYYFSHDANARHDEKILMLRAEHGWEGYGIYWALIEMMFENSETALCHRKIKGIATTHNIDIALLEGVINTCIEEELFVSNGDKFWSEGLLKRKSKIDNLKQKRSDAGKKGMAIRWENKETNNTVITSDNNTITNNNKGKESKEKKKESKAKEPKNSLSRKTKKVFHDGQIEMALALKLKKMMLQNNPNAKIPNDLQKWAYEFDLMLRVDNRDPKEVFEIIEFSQGDSFWRANILSPGALRKKYDQLYLKSNKTGFKAEPEAWGAIKQWLAKKEAMHANDDT